MLRGGRGLVGKQRKSAYELARGAGLLASSVERAGTPSQALFALCGDKLEAVGNASQDWPDAGAHFALRYGLARAALKMVDNRGLLLRDLGRRQGRGDARRAYAAARASAGSWRPSRPRPDGTGRRRSSRRRRVDCMGRSIQREMASFRRRKTQDFAIMLRQFAQAGADAAAGAAAAVEALEAPPDAQPCKDGERSGKTPGPIPPGRGAARATG